MTPPRSCHLAFRLEPQIAPCLCWAALGSALAAHYGLEDAPGQRDLVIRIFGRFDPKPAPAEAVLQALGLLKAQIHRPLTAEEIRAEITAGRVIAAEIALGFGGAHLVAISGIAADDRVQVDDPRSGRSLMPLAELVADPGGWWSWRRSFLTGPPG